MQRLRVRTVCSQYRLKIPGIIVVVTLTESGFGGLEDACWPLVLKFVGSNPAKPSDFSGRKNPHHAFLRRGSKAGGPMS
jgi:hypothetical protein